MNDKQFKIGQRWRRRDGSEDIITSNDGGPSITFKGVSGTIYSWRGAIYLGDVEHKHDLVELIEDVSPEKPKYEKCEGCGHLRGYCTLGHKCNCGAYYKPLTEDVPPAEPKAKPLFTVGMEGATIRRGNAVRILAVDLESEKSIVGAIKHSKGGEYLHCWLANGSSNGSSEPETHDLMPPPPPKQYAWLNVYRHNLYLGKLVTGSVIHSSRGEADAKVVENDRKRVGCIRVELAERWDD